MSDRFFTFMVIPEKSDRVRKISIPTAYLRLLSLLSVVLIVLGFFVFFDYIHLLSQVAENKKLKLENHVLRIDVEEAKTKLDTLDQSVSRLKSFAQKLRVISNLDQPGTSKLLEAPAGAPAVSPTNIQEEESGSIDDPNASNLPPAQQSEERVMQAGDKHDQLEYQRSLTMPQGEQETQVLSDNILGSLEMISRNTEDLIQTTLIEEQGLADLQEHMQDNVVRLRATPSILPARGWISSEFGYRVNPFSGSKTFHAGIDIANFTGTPVYATADGLVSYAGPRGGYGNVVQIDHGFGIVTRFGHNSKLLVSVGKRIRRGEKIAEIGSTGRSTAPHCHYEVVLNGRPVNPRAFILEETF